MTTLPEFDLEKILKHADGLYDPVKAHEYYMRTRKLKGRTKSSNHTTNVNRGSHETISPTYMVKTGTNKTTKLTAQQLEEQRVYAAARVQSIKKKLADLNRKLKEKIAAAQKREAAAKKPPTAAEKAKAARDAKIYRDTHKAKIAAANRKAAAKSKAKTTKHTDTVASLKKDIAATQASLKDAVAKQRNLAAAKKNG